MASQKRSDRIHPRVRTDERTHLSVTPVESCPLFGAIESNSSKNSKHGLALLAFWKRSLTPASLAPMYLFKSSGPL